MNKIRLGKTGLQVHPVGFGALPIQRAGFEDAEVILRKAFANGIDFYDTARYYTDSEEKIGRALGANRNSIVIATKSAATTRIGLLNDLETSLKNLATDHVDIMQLHNPPALPDFNDPQSAYAGLIEARSRGMTRYIGISNHKLTVAHEAARCGLFDTIQYPLNTLSTIEELTLVEECVKADCGLIAMKPVSGGLITDIASAFAFLMQYGTVLPIWGIQKESELDQFIAFCKNPPVLDAARISVIENDRRELSGKFCRGCGYCMPCPAAIEINWVARISLLLRRSPSQYYNNDFWKNKMGKIRQCTHCGACIKKCPYGLDIPKLLQENLVDFEGFFTGK